MKLGYKNFNWRNCIINAYFAVGDERPPNMPVFGPRFGAWVCKTFRLHRKGDGVPPLWMLDWGWWGRGDGKITCSCACCGASRELTWDDYPEVLALASDLLDQAQWSADFNNLHLDVDGEHLGYVLFRAVPAYSMPKWPKLPKWPKGKGKSSSETATGGT